MQPITGYYFRENEKEEEKEKPDMTDFETFSNNFDKIEKQHRKAGKAMVKGGVSTKYFIWAKAFCQKVSFAFRLDHMKGTRARCTQGSRN